MSEQLNNKEQQQLAMQRARLLKANNVQRRRFEKMVDEIIDNKRNGLRAKEQQQEEEIEAALIKEKLGHDLKTLLDIRAQVQAKKRELEAITKSEQAADLRRRLNKRGFKSTPTETYRGVQDPLEFYFDPPAVDVKSEDVCQVIKGDPLVQVRIIQCDNNPLVKELKARLIDQVTVRQEFQSAAMDLRSQVWGLVTTDEILDAINQFKKEW